ncbi:MAG: L-lactate dehydrogenase [Ornithinimicrobium sp.]
MPAIDNTPPTLAIIGAGSVGATMAYTALAQGIARRVVLHDINATKLEAEELDISQGLSFMRRGEIVTSDDIEIVRGARMVVVTAGAKQKPGQSRMDLAASTIGLTRTLLPNLLEVAPDATYLMVTNPVDVVTTAALRVTGLNSQQLFGSGTVLDSSRLRQEISERVGVAVQSVHAYVVGEHGDTEFPLWSAASIGGFPLLEWFHNTGRLDEFERNDIAASVMGAAGRIIAGKGATNYAVAMSCCSIIDAVLRDESRVMPVSTWLDEYYGISNVCLSVPTVVDKHGAHWRMPASMTDEELIKLRRSADSIKKIAATFGL